MFLSVQQLSKAYSDKKILQDISFEVKQGEMLVVLGPSGCGKSTLLSCLNGFETVTSGHISLNGKDITETLPEERDITTVFQSYSLFPHMNVTENLKYGLKFKKYSKKNVIEKVQEMLKLLRMEDYANAPIQSLSGGQQQRVALGRSLIVEPKLLLLDEPLSNLDEKLRVSMREEIRRVQRDLDITMIFVTHDQQEAFAIADRILLLDKGKIQQISAGPELYEHPNNSFVLSFIGEANRLSAGKYIRPEKIRLQSDQNGLGVIKDRIFQGATINYQVRYKDHDYLITTLNNDRLHEIGEQVELTFESQTIKLKGE